jgi:hypothetical protein
MNQIDAGNVQKTVLIPGHEFQSVLHRLAGDPEVLDPGSMTAFSVGGQVRRRF